MAVTALAYTAVPVTAAGVAGLIASLHRPGPRVTSALQHFAAGVVFAAAAIELIPKVLMQAPEVAIGGFAAGIAVMFGLRALTTRVEARHEAQARSGIALGLIAATGMDFLIDGGVLGAGFSAGRSTGLLLTIAITIEYLFVGLSVASTMGTAVSRRVVAATPLGLSLLTVVGAAFGIALLGGVTTTVLAGVLAFGAVVFMYLVTEQLLVEAHRRGETAPGSVTYFVGFLIYLVLQEILG